MLNDKIAASVQTNGTNDECVRYKLVKIELEEGVYELRFDFIKPGLEIDWIEFRQV